MSWALWRAMRSRGGRDESRMQRKQDWAVRGIRVHWSTPSYLIENTTLKLRALYFLYNTFGAICQWQKSTGRLSPSEIPQINLYRVNDARLQARALRYTRHGRYRPQTR